METEPSEEPIVISKTTGMHLMRALGGVMHPDDVPVLKEMLEEEGIDPRLADQRLFRDTNSNG